MFFRKKRRTLKKVADLEKKILDLQSQLEARDRTISVLESENDVGWDYFVAGMSGSSYYQLPRVL